MPIIGLLADGIMSLRKKSAKNKAKKNFETQTVSYQNKFAIDIPVILKSTSKLSKEASVQFYNKTLDIGVVVIEEPKDEFLTEWNNLQHLIYEAGQAAVPVKDTLLDKFMSVALFSMFSGEDVEPANYQSRFINGMPAVSVEVLKKRTFTKDASYTHITCIEGRRTLYQVIAIVGGKSITDFSSRLAEVASTLREL